MALASARRQSPVQKLLQSKPEHRTLQCQLDYSTLTQSTIICRETMIKSATAVHILNQS